MNSGDLSSATTPHHTFIQANIDATYTHLKRECKQTSMLLPPIIGPLYVVFLTWGHGSPSYYFDPLSLYDVAEVAVDEKDLVIGNCVWMEMDRAYDLVVQP